MKPSETAPDDGVGHQRLHAGEGSEDEIAVEPVEHRPAVAFDGAEGVVVMFIASGTLE